MKEKMKIEHAKTVQGFSATTRVKEERGKAR
jgi:hypothetical protein